jgi:hypothetical protein
MPVGKQQAQILRIFHSKGPGAERYFALPASRNAAELSVTSMNAPGMKSVISDVSRTSSRA